METMPFMFAFLASKDIREVERIVVSGGGGSMVASPCPQAVAPFCCDVHFACGVIVSKNSA